MKSILRLRKELFSFSLVFFTASLLMVLFSFTGDDSSAWPDAQSRKYGVYALDLPFPLEFSGEVVPQNDYDILAGEQLLSIADTHVL
jgi:hypothetical protein